MYGQSLMSMPPPFAAIEQYPPGRHIQRAPPTSVARQQQHHVASAYAQQPPGPPSVHHQGTRGGSSGGHLSSPGGGAGVPSPSASGPHPLPPRPPPPFMPTDPQSPRSGPPEVVHVWVPNNMVGALIGTKGVHIRNVMRLTGAHIRIEATKVEAGNGAEPEPAGNERRGQSDTERRVTVTGNDFQQYKVRTKLLCTFC